MDSKQVLSIFDEITKIPRESGHEELITSYLLDYAKRLGLEAKSDEIGNVVIIKEAAPGMENRPTIVLQSHSDMVCEKNEGVEHDFSKDPIRYEIENGWLIAKDTTLGADCGIGVAAQLAVLESDMKLGRIEALFTVSEETGLYGAKALKPGFITGNILINLDSEDEGELFVGCAGGEDTTARMSYVPVPVKEGRTAYSIKIAGGLGGHSGDDIDKGRANAVRLLARFLYQCSGEDFQLCSFLGGNKRNAIAREAVAVIAANEAVAGKMRGDFEAFVSDIRGEFAITDPGLYGVFEQTALPDEAMDCCFSRRLVGVLSAVAHGVLGMSADIKGLVETSTNLASVKLERPGLVRIGTSQRSSVTSERRAAADQVSAAFELAGAVVTHESEYPGWKPRMDSPLLKRCVASYEKLFGKTPVVRAIHAGLECGLFLDIYPNLDMISFGPTLRGVHAPGERLDLASLDKFVAFLQDILLNYEQ
ncbi:MAG: aminoacyl-histidine dipeptidase [Bacteroidetes bacterium]|uniref:Cytosol non-specific dipeptidase n=1 Tax=Candidatus Merdivivens pullicola TaxID=2840872 RepID=A0A9D9NH42_9BACT|nr:aminoacyl-histidine dipeptidase [Candidatus Merdivivens pullicola]